MDYNKAAADNMTALKNNEYPGRGIVIGQTPDEKHYVQIYWIMGRSENSRNRIFEQVGDDVRTKAFKEEKVEDPSLIIYFPARNYEDHHIITNGDQTDTVYNYLKEGKSFDDALLTREYEPDAPNYTPRISGLISYTEKKYYLSILKSLDAGTLCCQRHFFKYDSFQKGLGHCITTYKANGNPIPSFEGEPFVVPILNTIDENLSTYWDHLNEDNRISLLVKFIDASTGNAQIKIINKNV